MSALGAILVVIGAALMVAEAHVPSQVKRVTSQRPQSQRSSNHGKGAPHGGNQRSTIDVASRSYFVQ
jgi:hypothetical protein